MRSTLVIISLLSVMKYEFVSESGLTVCVGVCWCVCVSRGWPGKEKWSDRHLVKLFNDPFPVERLLVSFNTVLLPRS